MSDSSYIDAFLQVLQNRDPDEWWSRREERGHWSVKYKGWSPPCEFYIELGPTMVYLYSTLNVIIQGECRLAIYRYALRLNEEMSSAKFGLDPDRRLSLMVEWPRDNLTFASFETAVQTLVNYHKTHYLDIQLVAQDIELAKHVAAHDLQEQAEAEATQTKFEQSAQQE